MGQHLNLFKETTLEKQYIGMPFKDAEIHAKECCSDNLMRYHAFLYTVISTKVVGKNVHATIPKGNMGYDQYTVPDDCSCRTYFNLLLSFSTRKHISMAFCANSFKFLCKKRTENHTQCLSGL